ncbi:MAG: hypothetical protein KDE27_32115 [Planctomycetes bacterium]|nr:hypothetical protein [Planctomycetota bacterium]
MIRPFALPSFCLTALLPLAAQAPQVLSSSSGPGTRHPVVALDADAVAWVAMPASGRELYVAATDGSPPVQLTTGANVRVGHGTFDQWSPISISDDGNVLAYWNPQGVHVLDRQANTDTVVSSAFLLAFPRLAGDGSRLVYQDNDPITGDHEVFLVDSAGTNPPVQLTQNSGAGRRLPFLRGDQVLFQKPVGAQMELFVYDLVTSTLGPALTSGSGGGNRHGRFTPAGDAVVYEAVVGDEQTAMVLDLATMTATAIGGGSSGARMPQGDGDGQVVLQSTVTMPAVELYDPTIATVSAGSRGGNRLPSLDRHGQLIAWQEEFQGQLEVFVLRRAWPAMVSTYGTAGTPSTGSVQVFDYEERLDLHLGVDTQLGSVGAVFALGFQQTNLPVNGAPGNSQLVIPVASLFLLTDPQGDAEIAIRLSPNLLGFGFAAQFAVLDTPANAAGIVTSQGLAVLIR